MEDWVYPTSDNVNSEVIVWQCVAIAGRDYSDEILLFVNSWVQGHERMVMVRCQFTISVDTFLTRGQGQISVIGATLDKSRSTTEDVKMLFKG
jgi:hypothetical protein